jgi:hypothetical protein
MENSNHLQSPRYQDNQAENEYIQSNKNGDNNLS